MSERDKINKQWYDQLKTQNDARDRVASKITSNKDETVDADSDKPCTVEEIKDDDVGEKIVELNKDEEEEDDASKLEKLVYGEDKKEDKSDKEEIKLIDTKDKGVEDDEKVDVGQMDTQADGESTYVSNLEELD